MSGLQTGDDPVDVRGDFAAASSAGAAGRSPFMSERGKQREPPCMREPARRRAVWSTGRPGRCRTPPEGPRPRPARLGWSADEVGRVLHELWSAAHWCHPSRSASYGT